MILYHGTSINNISEINGDGYIKPDTYFTNEISEAIEYAESFGADGAIVKIDIDEPESLFAPNKLLAESMYENGDLEIDPSNLTLEESLKELGSIVSTEKIYYFDLMEVQRAKALVHLQEKKEKELFKNKIIAQADKDPNILKQFTEGCIYSYAERLHRNQDDFVEGDLAARIEEYSYYNLTKEFNLRDLDRNEWSVDEDLVEEYKEKIIVDGIESMPPIIVSDDDSIIDGIHRLNAMLSLGIYTANVFVGSNEELKYNNFKPTVRTTDKNLQIKRYEIPFGHIDIMENAEYSPAQNSVVEFLVDPNFRGQGLGKILVDHVSDIYQDLGAQISSKASLKVFHDAGFASISESINFEDVLYEFDEAGYSLFLRKKEGRKYKLKR